MKLPYLQFIFIGLVFPGLDALLSAWCFASTKETQKTQLCHQSCPLLEQSLPTQCPTCGFCLPARFPHGTTGSLEAKGRYDRDPENTKLFTQLTDA